MIGVLFSFVLVALGQPAWIGSFGSIAAVIGFACFWRSTLFLSPKWKFWYASIWFCLIQAVQLSWMATFDYMGPFISVVYLFLIMALGAEFGLVTLLLSFPLTLSRILAISGAWVLLEWSRLFFLCGFTWNPVGLFLSYSPYSLQFASLFGIFGLSFWVFFVNLLGLRAFLSRKAGHVVLFACMALLPYIFGIMQMVWVKQKPAKMLQAALVQTGLFPEEKEYFAHVPHKYISPIHQWERILSVVDLKHKVDLLVMPEAALPLGAHGAGFDLERMEKYFKPESLAPLQPPFAIFDRGKWRVSNVFILQTIANELGAQVVAGLDDVDATGKYNAAFHFRPGRVTYERYEKRVLVPIGEYVPLRTWQRFSRLIAKQFGIYGSFDAGCEAKVFAGSCPLGASICLEETFSNLTRELRLKGAELLVNLTNDVWFPRSLLAKQHFDHGRIRAVENGMPLVRSCNTGITGGVDCLGQTLALLPPSESSANVLYLTVPLRTFQTLYTKWGDLPIVLFSSLCCVFFALRLLQREEKVAVNP